MLLKKILLLNHKISEVKEFYEELKEQEEKNNNFLNEINLLKKENIDLKKKLDRLNSEHGKTIIYQEALKKICISMSKDIGLLSNILSKVLSGAPLKDIITELYRYEEQESGSKEEYCEDNFEYLEEDEYELEEDEYEESLEFEDVLKINPDSFFLNVSKKKKKVYH